MIKIFNVYLASIFILPQIEKLEINLKKITNFRIKEKNGFGKNKKKGCSLYAHCIEGLNLTKSNQLKDTLVTLRAKESF